MIAPRFLVSGTVALCGLSAAASAFAACDMPGHVPDTRYELNGGEVYDKETGLTWQRCSVGQTWAEGKGCAGKVQLLTRDQAVKQASGDWRLPTREELLSLLSAACAPSIDPAAFPGMDETKHWYWSNTPTPSRDGLGWIVDFKGGGYYGDYPTKKYAVRLVKDGR